MDFKVMSRVEKKYSIFILTNLLLEKIFMPGFM